MKFTITMGMTESRGGIVVMVMVREEIQDLDQEKGVMRMHLMMRRT